MLEQAMLPIVSPIHHNNWFGTTAWETVVKNKHLFFNIMQTIQPGTMVKGHSAYLREFEQTMFSFGISTIFIYRDLRDVVVSTANHFMKATPDGDLKHPRSEVYKKLDTFEDVMIAVIEGIDEEPGLFERWHCYTGWLNCKWVFKVRFEDLRYKSLQTCHRILEYCLGAVALEYGLQSMPTEKRMARDMVKAMENRKASKTFQKGKRNAWRKAFTPKVKDCFKAHDEGSYAHLTQIKRQWEENNDNSTTTTEPIMIEYGRRATGVIDAMTHMEFAPRIETRYFDACGDHIDGKRNTMMLDKFILELTSTTLADGTSLTTDTDVRLYPRGRAHALELQIYYPNTKSWREFTNEPWQNIVITGSWGYRLYYNSDGWLSTGDTVQDAGGINETVTEVTVTDADGADYYSDTPRFDEGMMIKIDSEFMAVTSVDTATQKLTVIRGIRGSTAAVHANAAAITRWYPQPEIVRATQLIAMYNYARRGKTTAATFDGVTTTTNVEIPNEAVDIIEQYVSLHQMLSVVR
jgi:hypothetical protein